MIAKSASLNNKAIKKIKQSYEEYKKGKKEHQQSSSNLSDDEEDIFGEFLFDKLFEIDKKIDFWKRQEKYERNGALQHLE